MALHIMHCCIVAVHSEVQTVACSLDLEVVKSLGCIARWADLMRDKHPFVPHYFISIRMLVFNGCMLVDLGCV